MVISFNELKKYNPEKDTYFVFGDPVSHSLSPKLHKKFFELYNIDAQYIGVHVSPENLKEALEIIKPYAKGLNLTIPHKKAVIPLLDEISEDAEIIGAVNTVVFKNGKMTGYNTDTSGLELTLEKYGFSLKNKKVLILGNGGVCEAFLNVCLKYTKDITVAGRSLEKVMAFCNGTVAKACLISEIKDENFDILLNGTPVGMSKTADKCPIDYRLIKNFSFVFDSIYNPLFTNLTVFSDMYNVKNTSGLYMLIFQGLKAQELWGNPYGRNDSDLIFESLKNDFGTTVKNIVLTGYMGSGKTTASKMLSDKTDKIVIDTDSIIEETENMKISEIFEKYGEEYFRKKETELTEKICRLNGVIISTGGGIIKNKENIKNLQKNGIVFFINPDISEVEKRLIDDKDRPLIRNRENIRKIYEERLPLYRKLSDYTVNNNDTLKNAGEIIEIYEKVFSKL